MGLNDGLSGKVAGLILDCASAAIKTSLRWTQSGSGELCQSCCRQKLLATTPSSDSSRALLWRVIRRCQRWAVKRNVCAVDRNAHVLKTRALHACSGQEQLRGAWQGRSRSVRCFEKGRQVRMVETFRFEEWLVRLFQEPGISPWSLCAPRPMRDVRSTCSNDL